MNSVIQKHNSYALITELAFSVMQTEPILYTVITA